MERPAKMLSVILAPAWRKQHWGGKKAANNRRESECCCGRTHGIDGLPRETAANCGQYLNEAFLDFWNVNSRCGRHIWTLPISSAPQSSYDMHGDMESRAMTEEG